MDGIVVADEISGSLRKGDIGYKLWMDLRFCHRRHSYWRSICCMPDRPAFEASAPINLSERLNPVLRWALGWVEILFSRHCPIWYGYGGRLMWLERYTLSLPFLFYFIVRCQLSACLLGNSLSLRSFDQRLQL